MNQQFISTKFIFTNDYACYASSSDKSKDTIITQDTYTNFQAIRTCRRSSRRLCHDWSFNLYSLIAIHYLARQLSNKHKEAPVGKRWKAQDIRFFYICMYVY